MCLINVSIVCPNCGEVTTKKFSPTNSYFSSKVVCPKCQNSHDFLSSIVSNDPNGEDSQTVTSSGIILIQQWAANWRHGFGSPTKLPFFISKKQSTYFEIIKKYDIIYSIKF